MKTSIIYLKTGKFSISPIHGPVALCKKDEIVEIDPGHAQVLADAGWAEILEDEVVQSEDDSDGGKGDEDLPIPPWNQEDCNPEADDAKDLLEVYGLEVFDTDIDKRKSVTKIIEQLEALEELTGDN